MSKRVLQVSLDILIDESIDGEDLAKTIRTELEEYGLGLTILNAEFQHDVTEKYTMEVSVIHTKLKVSGNMVEISIDPKED